MKGHPASLALVFLFQAFYIIQRAQRTESSRYIIIGDDNVTVHNDLKPIPNAYNQCYVNVFVYNSSTFNFGLKNAIVTVLSNKKVVERNGKNKTEYDYSSSVQTSETGQACVLAECHVECEIFVEKDGIRILAATTDTQEKHLPPRFNVNVLKGNEIVNFYSYAWGTINGKSGPVFKAQEKSMCKVGNILDYRFVFSYISVPDQLVSTLAPMNTTDLNNSEAWVYGLPGYRHYCYLKIRIKTQSTQSAFTAVSQFDNSMGAVIGKYISGPKYDSSLDDKTTKAVCLQYRCPVTDTYTSQNVATFVLGNATIPGRPNGCCVRNQALKPALTTPSTFNMTFTVDIRFGPREGVYMSETDITARARCYAGRDFLGTEYAIDVNKGTAFEYDCTDDCILNNPVVG